MVMVFAAVGLPLESIGLLFTVDWFLDRLRTCCNVLGDAFVAAMVDHLVDHSDHEEEEGKMNEIVGSYQHMYCPNFSSFLSSCIIFRFLMASDFFSKRADGIGIRK